MQNNKYRVDLLFFHLAEERRASHQKYDNYFENSYYEILTHLLTPFSMVSSTRVDASCTNVFVLAVEKPEIAEDSEIEERLEWSNGGEMPERGPKTPILFHLLFGLHKSSSSESFYIFFVCFVWQIKLIIYTHKIIRRRCVQRVFDCLFVCWPLNNQLYNDFKLK